MCFSSPSPPPEIKPVPAPAAPPPAANQPSSPAFNEATTSASNANVAVADKRRGRSSLRIDLKKPSGGAPGAAAGLGMPPGGAGLNIPQ